MSMSRTTSYEAGHVLSAADALAGGQETFTREQVAQLVAMAFDSGRTSTWLEDIAETVSVWEDRAEARATYEERVQQRIKEMEHRAEMARLRAGLPTKEPYLGGPVEWGDDSTPYDVLTRRDRDILAAAEKLTPIGSVTGPGTRSYAEGWRDMRARLTVRQWDNLAGGFDPVLGPRTLAGIGTLDEEDRRNGKRRFTVIPGGAA